MRTSRSWACRDGEFHTYCLLLLCLRGTDETPFSPGGLNKHLAHMAKLPISFIASLCSLFRTMSPCLTEDRVYDRAASNFSCCANSHRCRNRNGREQWLHNLFTECFTKQFTKNYEYPDFGYFRNSVYRAASPLAPPLHVPPCVARPGYEAITSCIYFLSTATAHYVWMG